MEKIENSVCKIFIDDSYRNFGKDFSYIYKTDDEDISKVYDKVLVITDENVYKAQSHKFINSIKAKCIYEYIVPSGEDSKSLDFFEKAIAKGLECGLTRKSLIIALGGGVIGDLAGYVASSYMRGIDFIQVPTSLLAQVDSSVGGKTGINLGIHKNVIGAFYRPKFTYINIQALRTLPDEEFKSGMGEVIKYGFIYDYEFIDYLIENSDYILDKKDSALEYLIKKCIEIKAHVVEVDEKESGLRKILNLGHTFGHGIEKLCHMSHGEAVVVGMNMAFKLSLSKGLVDEDYYNKFLLLCEKYGLSTTFSGADEKEVLDLMKNDKKNSFTKVNLILPVAKGEVKLFDDIDDETILNTIKECKNA